MFFERRDRVLKNFKDKKKKKIVSLVIITLILIVSIASATYAYFALSASDSETIGGTVGGVSLELTVSKELPVSTPSTMIPQLESTLEDAVSSEYNCIDDNNNVVCQVYKATLKNNGSIAAIVDGTITFENISTLPNLKWKRIDSITNFGNYDSYNATTEDHLFEDDKQLLAGDVVDYYFVIWVDEVNLEQEDEGTFRATIYFDAAGGGVSSTVGSDTNGASYITSLYDSSRATSYHIGGDSNKPEVSLLPLNSEDEETWGLMLDNNGDYRYYGKNPNNYVNFNGELWRIISSGTVYSNENDTVGEQRLRIIKDMPIGNYAWDSDENYSNNWVDATLMCQLNTMYYNDTIAACDGKSLTSLNTSLSSEARGLIDDALWYLGGGNDSDLYADDYYTMERGTTVVDSTYPTRWTGSVGIMYPSDYAYAADLSKCTKIGDNYYTDTTNCTGTDWLFNNDYQWLISTISSSAFRVDVSGYLDDWGIFGVEDVIGVRPVVVLKSNVKITGGSGTSGDAYKLELG